MAFKMTDEFAGAMVTVIPVIMVVATVEFQAILQRKAVDVPETGALTRRDQRRLELNLMQLLVYGALIATHAEVEIRLIGWLANPKHGPDPELAREVYYVGCAGFLWVAGWAAMVVTVKEFRIFKSAWDRRRRGQATPAPRPSRAARPQLPRQRARATLRSAHQRAARTARPPRPRSAARQSHSRSGARP